MKSAPTFSTKTGVTGSNFSFLRTSFLVFYSSACMLLMSCTGEEILPESEYYTQEEYSRLSGQFSLPSTFDVYSPFEIPGKPDYGRDAKATLGRVLFYDVNLSIDNSVSCGSCHRQELAFADDVAFSKGVNGRSTTRNSMALGVFPGFTSYANLASTRLFWDRRAVDVHDQMTQTLANPDEMGMELNFMVEKLNKLDYYSILTMKAYGTEILDPFTTLDAISHFMNSLLSSNTKFDAALQNNKFNDLHGNWYGLTEIENKGKNIYLTSCVSCHKLKASSSSSNIISLGDAMIVEANNGLDLSYTDNGAGDVHHLPEMIGVFKIPSLRNVALTAPYMHDGRFSTLEEVIDFYSEGIQDHKNLHPLLKDENGEPVRLQLHEEDKGALISFLNTLTDVNLTVDQKWSDPFLQN